jgi:hypothetical protein
VFSGGISRGEEQLRDGELQRDEARVAARGSLPR